MRVLVTGGTGFIGSHAVAALKRDRHSVRILARSSSKADQVLAEHRVDAEVVIGDMTDEEAVNEAVDGCDALIHAAGEIGVAAGVGPAGNSNLLGAKTVMKAAVDAGLDPIIYTSSVTVHYPTTDVQIGVTSPLADPMSVYGTSKRDIEILARDLGDRGLPVTTFVIGGVYGPISPHLDHSFTAIIAALELMMLAPPAGTNVIDVRDLAQMLSRAVEPGRGPRRYLAGGHFVTWHEWVETLSRASGVDVVSRDVSVEELLTMGRQCDELRVPGEPSLPLSEESAIIMCSGRPTDDTATLSDLRLTYRPLHETFEDTVNYLRSIGRLPYLGA